MKKILLLLFPLFLLAACSSSSDDIIVKEFTDEDWESFAHKWYWVDDFTYPANGGEFIYTPAPVENTGIIIYADRTYTTFDGDAESEKKPLKIYGIEINAIYSTRIEMEDINNGKWCRFALYPVTDLPIYEHTGRMEIEIPGHPNVTGKRYYRYD